MLHARDHEDNAVMKAFTLYLQDPLHTERIEDVTSFVGEDASGSFGILAGHTRFMTSLVFGLARFRLGKENWQYLALPGAILYFLDNKMFLSTRHYVRGDNYEYVSSLLRKQLAAEEEELRSIKESLHRMEQELFKRMWKMRYDRG